LKGKEEGAALENGKEERLPGPGRQLRTRKAGLPPLLFSGGDHEGRKDCTVRGKSLGKKTEARLSVFAASLQQYKASENILPAKKERIEEKT